MGRAAITRIIEACRPGRNLLQKEYARERHGMWTHRAGNAILSRTTATRTPGVLLVIPCTVLLSLLLAVPQPAPITDAFRLYQEGRLDAARRVLSPDGETPPASPAEALLFARLLLAEGQAPEARRLLEAPGAPAARIVPWAELLRAEAVLRAGDPRAARTLLEALAHGPDAGRQFRERRGHLLVITGMLHRIPDEPMGVLALSRDAADEQAAERMSRAPLLTLARAPDRRDHVLAAFVDVHHCAVLGIIDTGLAPLARAHPALGCVVLVHAPDLTTFQEIRARLLSLAPESSLHVLWARRAEAFIAYGIARPPFFLLVGPRYEDGVKDWEPPWGSPPAFFLRVKARLED